MSKYSYRRSTMKELLDNGELLNCTLLTEDGGAFEVHLEVVLGRSPYLKRIMVNASKENADLSRILIPEATRDVMANIVNFMYMGQLEVTYEKVEELAKMGELLVMPDIVKFCKKFLVSNLTHERCIAVYEIAKRRGYSDLKATAKSYLLKHFQHVFPISTDYLDLGEEDLVEILSSDHLNVSGEESVFWAILRWIEKNPEVRATTSLPNLLRCIRFGLCSQMFLEGQASQVFEDLPTPRGEDVTLRTLLLDSRHPFLRPRIPAEIIFVMGGWSAGSATNVIETFDVKSGRWFLSLYTDSTPRAYHGMLWHEGYVYVIGGFDGNQCFSTVHRYDPVGHTWQEVGCMHEQRCYVSVASVDDYIYAMGGYDGHRRNRSCERFDPVANQWDKVAHMNQVRSDASADALNGKIYVAGGFNGQQVLNSVECYDPSTDAWTLITEMNTPRSGVKLVAYHGQLYIIGGFNGNTRLSTVDKYDLHARHWSAVASMNSPRSNFATAILNDCLYVIGGFNGLATISGVECYHQQRNEWQPVTEMNLNRSALSACTISDIPNLNEYTFLGNVPSA